MTKKPRICEHEESKISRDLISMVFTIENLEVAKYEDLWNEQKDAADYYASKITRYLNTKKACTRCAKKK